MTSEINMLIIVCYLLNTSY